MPSLGSDMDTGTLVEWLVEPGDHVRRGDVVAVVETQKGAIEIEIFNTGTVSDLVVPVGTRVPVGTVLARLEGAEAAPALTLAPAPQTAQVPPPAPAAPPAVTPAAIGITPSVADERRPRASPAARRLAAERGADQRLLRGTGLAGAVTLGDVEAAIGGTPGRPTAIAPTGMRQAIAAAMARSKREIPHYYLTQTVDVGAALARLERLNAERPPTERVLPAALFLRCIAHAVAKRRDLNGFWENGGFRPGDGVHIGWAVALRGGGLVAPAIRDTDRHSLTEIMAALRDLVQRARTGGLRSSELSNPTITVTSLGERGAESVLPIIHPPQVAMLGIGRIVTRPWVTEGVVAPRPVVTLTLAGDHRASDGHLGGLLLTEVGRLLQEEDAS